MEKKVLLKDLVETGTSLRKQITPKVRLSDQGVYPIGEIWDANTTLSTIVDGASIAFDTLKEVEDKLLEVDDAIHNLDEDKADKSSTYTKTDVDNIIGDLGQIPDIYATYSFDLYDEQGLTLYSSGKAQLTEVETNEYYQIVITQNIPVNDWQDELVGKKFFIEKDAVFDGQTLVLLYKLDKSSAGIALKMIEISPTTYKNPTVKEYIDYSIMKHISEGGYIIDVIPVNSIDTQNIVDGSIQIEDLSDDIKEKLQPTVDEDDENVFIG